MIFLTIFMLISDGVQDTDKKSTSKDSDSNIPYNNGKNFTLRNTDENIILRGNDRDIISRPSDKNIISRDISQHFTSRKGTIGISLKKRFPWLYKTEENLITKLQTIIQEYHTYRLFEFFGKRRFWHTSSVGHRMFKDNVDKKYTKRNKSFIIYVFSKSYNWFRSRHLIGWYKEDPFGTCSVRNCKLTNNFHEMKVADAVVINVQHGTLPQMWRRRPFQRWVYLTDESPKNMFSKAKNAPNLTTWANIFNWTMTYRTDSDVPVPYGRTLPRSPHFSPTDIPESITDMIPFWKIKKRDVLLTTLMSSCHVKKRINYVKRLQKHIPVDFYGKCSENNSNSCPGRYKSDCALLKNYIFYLAFENSGCRQYITEKTFHHSFLKGAIPIIMGPPKEDCNKLLPPHSFIHVDDFTSPRALSKYILRISNNVDKLLMYHNWRRFFKITNEHGYSGTASQAICRLCEALNYNSAKPKVYSDNDLNLFHNFNLLCVY